MEHSQLMLINRLYAEASQIVLRRLHKRLEPAHLAIQDMSGTWGLWNPSKRIIALSVKLVNYYETDAVRYVLFHEVAHQIVTEIFNFDCHGCPHGEHFKKACEILEIPNNVCSSHDFLAGFKSGHKSPIIEKVIKLMNTTGRTESEQKAFLAKAHTIMFKHNLSMVDIHGEESIYAKRSVGESYKRFPSYLFDVAGLVSEFYGVKYIRSYHFVLDGINKNSRYHIEFFGTPEKLDVAEYIYNAILNNAEILYKDFKNSEDRAIGYRKISKKAFITGLVEGYKEKLKSTLKESEYEYQRAHDFEDTALLKMDDPMLKERYNDAYSHRRSIGYQASSGSGREAGREAGRSLSINQAVKSSGRSLMLC